MVSPRQTIQFIQIGQWDRIEIQDTSQHILKVLYNTWYITDVALQNSGSSLDCLINGAERNDYPYGKKEIGSLLHTA